MSSQASDAVTLSPLVELGVIDFEQSQLFYPRPQLAKPANMELQHKDYFWGSNRIAGFRAHVNITEQGRPFTGADYRRIPTAELWGDLEQLAVCANRIVNTQDWTQHLAVEFAKGTPVLFPKPEDSITALVYDGDAGEWKFFIYPINHKWERAIVVLFDSFC